MKTTRQLILDATDGETLTTNQLLKSLQDGGYNLILVSNINTILNSLLSEGKIIKSKIKQGGFWINGWRKK